MGLKIAWERKPKTHKRVIKDAKKLKKNVASTLSWMHIEEIQEHQIVLKSGNKKRYVRGIKIHPINIFIEDPYEQMMRVARLRNVYNRIKFKLYHSFVFNPINMDKELAYLSQRLDTETNPSIRELIQDDIEKSIMFIRDFNELEFFITIQSTTEKEAQIMMDDLVYEFERAGFQIDTLNIIDYENYSAYIFENQMINDYLFGHGAFQILAEVNVDDEESNINNTISEEVSDGEHISEK
ncbi:hypothetical protein [Erysipelothrix anatis]|uniref:hypothetical protein n=1 Tax=Erysipelothrix anatis TaxID=2683713 RepID=UPI00135C7A10|nr:hypothetical protein [Erysipelothrix anatis]